MVNKQYMGKPAGNFPAPAKAAGDMTATRQRTPPPGSVPATGKVTGYNPGYPSTGPAGSNPLTNGSDSMTLPMFNASTGYSDTGVGHTGDMGGAG